MREILFRGKDVSGNWHYGVPLTITDDCVCITALHTHNKTVIPSTVGQYTGLLDKNDKKIFEGDIVKSCECDDVFFIKYFDTDNYPAFDCVPDVPLCECNGLAFLVNEEGCEVIGNIHDNPELLKGE